TVPRLDSRRERLSLSGVPPPRRADETAACMHSISSSAGLPADSGARESTRVELRSLVGRRPRVDFRQGRGQLIALAVGLTVSGVLLYLTVRKLDVAAVLTALRTADPTR